MGRRLPSVIAFFAVFMFVHAQELGLQHTLEHPHFPTPDIPHTFRRATYDDFDDVVDVFFEAFSPSPEWRYAYQFKDDYPVYHRECVRETFLQRWREYWEHGDDSDTIMNVIEVPVVTKSHNDEQQQQQQSSRVVALGLWQIRGPNLEQRLQESKDMTFFRSNFFAATLLESIDSWKNCSLHLDANITRALDFRAQFEAFEHKYIDIAYPAGQILLSLLATHPDYDGHNFGATHCRWGMRLARQRQREEPVTLMSTPVGYPLYKSLGFEELKNLTISFLDGLGGTWAEVMEWRYDEHDI